MRVIAGKHKGYPLKAVPGSNTRPTTDKVKEALFSMIGPFFDGGNVLDLFAGSGALAIEALSRGCHHAVLVDQSATAIKTINQNLQALKMKGQTSVFRNEAKRALKWLHKNGQRFELIFLDPPYKNQQLEALIETIENLQLVKDQSIIICEHDKNALMPERVGGCLKYKTATYGTSALSIYKCTEGSHDTK